MTEKPKDKNPWVSRTTQDKPAIKDLSLNGILQNRPLSDPLQTLPKGPGTPITIQPKKLDQQTS